MSCLGHSVSVLCDRLMPGHEDNAREIFQSRSKVATMQRLAPNSGVLTQSGPTKIADVTPELMDRQFAQFESMHIELPVEAMRA